MTTEATAQATLAAVEADDPAATSSSRPYPPSWVNRLLDWLVRLPGPTWVAYAALGAIGAAGGVGLSLSSGIDDVAVLAGQVFWGLFLPLTLWLMHYLAGVAETSLDAFRPVVDASDAEIARLHYELAVAPARPAAIVLLLMAILTPTYYVLDPVASAIVGLSPLALGLRYASEVFFGGVSVVLVYQSIRQLRAVSRIQAQATHVDLLRPAPLYAFSILTSRTAIVIALVFLLPTSVTLDSFTSQSWWIWVPWIVGGIVTAAAVFVLPLRGVQQRIVVEKERLQAEVGLRVASTMAAVHRSVDDGDLAQAGALNSTLSSLIAERDLVSKLPTWPWQPGTGRAVVSAIVLPIGLWLTTRALERLV